MFSAQYALDEPLPLAEAAYDKTKLPAQWKAIGSIQTRNTGNIAQYIQPATGLCARSVKVSVNISGTEDLEQWLLDFDFFFVPNPYGPGRVARGALIWQQGLSKSIFDAIDVTGYDELLIIGHSAGGFLGALQAGQMVRDCPQYAARVTGYTFESPRVFDAEANAWFNRNFPRWYSVQNEDWDAVVHQAPQNLGFLTHGTPIRINSGMTFDLKQAHHLETGVRPGLVKLAQDAALQTGGKL
jgi:pimeloyl-ACP methyl ester carboxylesterase